MSYSGSPSFDRRPRYEEYPRSRNYGDDARARPAFSRRRDANGYGRDDDRRPQLGAPRFGGRPPLPDPKPSRVLGVFGLSLRTEERHLYDIFSQYGPLEDIQIVYDSLSGRSRGFAFVYYQTQEDARIAQEACATELVLHDRTLRVDYSLTTGPHPSTPGVYMGKDKRRNLPGRDRRYGYSDNRSRPVTTYRRSRSRSPVRRRSGASPYHRRSRVVSSSRSRSPPPVYNHASRSRSRSIPDRNGGRYAGPKDDWSRSASPM